MEILVSGLFSTAESYGKGTATTEIIIMLLVAFILGYLLRWLLSKDKYEDCSLWEDKYKKLEEQFKILENKNSELQTELDNCKSNQNLGFVSKSEESKPAKKDDLKKIEGIGPKIEQLLYAESIYTWDDLSKTKVEIIQAILDKAGPRYRMHNPGTWPEQAKLAAKGKWKKLEKWQDELKGGK